MLYKGIHGLMTLDICRVFLHATDQSALENGVSMDTLKKFAAEPEAQGGGGSLENRIPVTPGAKGGLAKETH